MKHGRLASGVQLWAVAVVAAASVLLTGCGTQTMQAPSQRAGDQTTSSQVKPPGPAVQTDRLPRGWRWESYGAVAVAVPSQWGWGTSEAPWCAPARGVKIGSAPPYVGRPGPVAAIGCGIARPAGTADPGTLIKNAGTFVWFEDPIGRRPADVKVTGDRATLTLAGVMVSVQAAKALRDRILSTVHEIPDGIAGCPGTHPISKDPGWRPAGPPVEDLTGVSAVSVCKYTRSNLLRSFLVLTGASASRAVAAIVKSPIGGGPDNPNDCLPQVAYGEEAIVLRIQSDQGVSEVVLRYSGCDHHGFDDGSRVRTLTRQAVAPFVAGPNQVLEVEGDMVNILPN